MNMKLCILKTISKTTNIVEIDHVIIEMPRRRHKYSSRWHWGPVLVGVSPAASTMFYVMFEAALRASFFCYNETTLTI